MRKYSSYNNNNASKMIHNCQDELSNSSNNSQTINIIRSVVDELYQINNEEILSRSESKEKRVRFTLEQEKEKSSFKHQPMLSESPMTVCCLVKSRSKVDCSVSTNDLPSLQCECATQTTDISSFSEYNHSLMSLLTTSNDLHQSRSNITLSTTSISSRSTTLHHRFSLNTAHQLIIPSEAKQYDICQEQTLDNCNTFINYNMNISNSSSKFEEITKTDIKLCTCAKRKLSDNHFSTMMFNFYNQNRLLEELHLSKRSLQSMYNDGLFYLHDLVLIFLRDIPQFYQLLVKHYYLSKKQANLLVKAMQNWWNKYQNEFMDMNEKVVTKCFS